MRSDKVTDRLMKLFKNQYVLYTVIFLSLLPIVFYPFIQEGKTFVWSTDGISQHYPSLIHYGQVLRDFISGKGFAMMDFSIGLGFDTITTLHYYILGDPVGLLAVFATPSNSILVYGILVILRMYLAGLSFMSLCRYFNKKTMGTTLGSLIYVFSGYALYAGVRHPYFLNPMIFLPVLIIGLEKVLRKERPTVLIIVSFLCSISNFYFLYYMSIMAVVYCIFRYTTIYHRSFTKKLGGLLITGLRVGSFYVLGIIMAAVVLLPILYTFTNSGRLEGEAKEAIGYLHYNKKYYLTLAQSFFATGISPGFWVRLSFPSITGISLAIMICNKKYAKLTVGFILTMICLCIPFFGKAMNGFAYISNRWCFFIALLMSIIFVYTYEQLLSLGMKEKIVILIGTIMYGIVTFYFPSGKTVKYEFVILVVTVCLLFLLQSTWFPKFSYMSCTVIFVIVYVTLGFHGFGYYSKDFHKYVNEFLTKEEVNESTFGDVVTSVHTIEDDEFYRIETSGDKTLNEGMAIGFNDVSAYFSLIDGRVSAYLKDLEILSQRNAYRFHDLDNRTILNTLSSVKYLLTSDKTVAPYGYELYNEINKNGKNYYIYKNTLFLPIAYVYKNYMLEEDYKNLSVLEKQNAMLYALILDEDSSHINKSNQDMGIGIQKLDAIIRPDDTIIMESNEIKVKKSNSKIELLFEGLHDSETYVYIRKFDIKKNGSAITTLKVKGEKEITKQLNMRNQYHTSYFGKENFLVNLGYSKTNITFASITFPKKETYSYDDIEVLSLNMNHYKEQVESLRENVIDNIRISNNKVSGNITLKEDGTMLFTIPYSVGWKAYVNGKEKELKPANLMYMALDLESGNNQIELRYVTPYLKVGIITSIIGFIGFGIVIWWNKHKGF